MMTKRKAAEILIAAFNTIFDEIKTDILATRADIEKGALMSQDIEVIKKLCEQLKAIDTASVCIDERKASIEACINNISDWYYRDLLSELFNVFLLLPPENEAK